MQALSSWDMFVPTVSTQQKGTNCLLNFYVILRTTQPFIKLVTPPVCAFELSIMVILTAY